MMVAQSLVPKFLSLKTISEPSFNSYHPKRTTRNIKTDKLTIIVYKKSMNDAMYFERLSSLFAWFA